MMRTGMTMADPFRLAAPLPQRGGRPGVRAGSAASRALRLLSAGALTVWLTGCAMLDTGKPALELPESTAATPAGIERWWTQFDDPQLSALIDEAMGANLDLQQAVSRIDEARAALQLARASLFPSLDAQFGATRARRSDATDQRFPGPLITTTYNGGLAASYEVDLFGRLASGRAGAAASLLSTRYAAETVRISLAAQVASTYFSLRAYDAELKLTRSTVEGREENVRLQKTRYEAGLANDYELRLAQAERAAVAAAVPLLERAVAQTESALAVLAGRSARAVFAPAIARGVELDKMSRAPDVPPGLPSDLLARRPDVRQAEAGLVAASAAIAEARAQYFPSLSLTARYGGESAELSDLFTSPARVWSVAGNLLQPIIGVNRINAQVKGAEARRRQSELAYVSTVQSAFRDAHDALIAHRSARAAQQAQEERSASLNEALRLANLRYKNGYSSLLEVLDAQRNLLDAERARINAIRDRQVALVDLYKALGGGWAPAQFAPDTAPGR
jgi:multidrug efflux system outer membrane protein